MSKFGNRPTEVDGIRFDSAAEARRWSELVLLERAGVISRLERQKPFPVEVNGKHICRYVSDFVYFNEAGERVVEDVKGVATDVYKLKKKLVEALYNVRIVEVRAR